MLPIKGHKYLCIDNSTNDGLESDPGVEKKGKNKLYTIGKIYLSTEDGFLDTDDEESNCRWSLEERFTRMFKIVGNKRKSNARISKERL